MELKKSLSSQNIKLLIEELKKIKQNLQNKLIILVEELGKKGIEISINQINKYNLPIDECYFIINEPLFVGNQAYIKLNTINQEATYYEFGIGIIGQNSPHPTMPWQYDVNEHGQEGWHYYKDYKWYWTNGEESKPFAYNTFEELKQYNNFIEIFKKVFNDL